MEYQAHVHLDACLRAAQPHRAKGWLQKPQNRLRIPSVRQAARKALPLVVDPAVNPEEIPGVFWLAKSLELLAIPAGFEPATHGVEIR
jgi:hypothetical protein